MTSHYLIAQQVANTAFRAKIENPTFESGKGPTVIIDQAHNNFHTLTGRISAFGKLLEADGYVVKASSLKITQNYLIIIYIFIH